MSYMKSNVNTIVIPINLLDTLHDVVIKPKAHVADTYSVHYVVTLYCCIPYTFMMSQVLP